MHDTPPSIPSVAFVNLSLPPRDVPYELHYVRQHLPCVVFVLYGSDEDFRRFMSSVQPAEAEHFNHYFLLKKPDPAPNEAFDAKVRGILDGAKSTTFKRIENYPRFSSAFISYSHQDQPFAKWLEDNLRTYGVRCWLDEKQLRAGDRIHTKVEEAILQRDKLLLCASKHSLSSWWVDNEINSVIAKEQRLWKERGGETLVLVPLNLDGYLFSNEWSSGWKNQIVSRLAPDFTRWDERLAVDTASTFERRMELLDRLGHGNFDRQNKALDSLRRALLIEEVPEQR